MEVVGVLNVEASYEGPNKVVQLHVVKGDGPSVLGRDWLQVIKLKLGSNKSSINPLSCFRQVTGQACCTIPGRTRFT